MTEQKISTILDTFDVIRLRNVTNLSTTELLTRELISFHLGPNTGLPVCNIELQNWTGNRAADLQRFLVETKDYQSRDTSANFGSLINKLVDSGFFAPPKIPIKNRPQPKSLLKEDSRLLLILTNILYNFDSFFYFSEDKRVLKTISEESTPGDFMYVFEKVYAST